MFFFLKSLTFFNLVVKHLYLSIYQEFSILIEIDTLHTTSGGHVMEF